MAEAMTVETIVEADWQMQGFWTKVRFPLQTIKGGWSDIDMVLFGVSASLSLPKSRL